MVSPRTFFLAVPFALTVLLVAACGNKGDLVKPPPNPAPQQQPAPPAAPAADQH